MSEIHGYIIPANHKLAQGAVELEGGMIAIDTASVECEMAYRVKTWDDERRTGKAWQWIRSQIKRRGSGPVTELLQAATDGDTFARMKLRAAGTVAGQHLGEGATIGYRLADGSVVCIGRSLASAAQVARYARVAQAPQGLERYRAALASASPVPRQLTA